MTTAAQGIMMPGWQLIPGGLSQVSAGSANNIWGVNSAGNIFNFTGTFNPIPGGLSCVSAASDGTVWGVNSGGNIYRRDGNSWTQIPGGLMQISVGSAKNVWGVNSGGNIYQYTGDDSNPWTQIPGGLSWVSAAADGTVWGVNSGGNIYRRDGSSWTQIPGGLMQISVGSAQNVWGVNSGGNIYQYTGDDSNPWVQIPGGLSNIAVGADGTVWGVNSNGNIYYYLQDNALMASNPRLGESNFQQGELANYLFDISNNAPGTNISNITIELLYDQAMFKANGISIDSNTIKVPGPLTFGSPTTAQFKLTATQNAVVGNYGLWGVKASYQISQATQSIPLQSGQGGWMTFTLIQD